MEESCNNLHEKNLFVKLGCTELAVFLVADPVNPVQESTRHDTLDI